MANDNPYGHQGPINGEENTEAIAAVLAESPDIG